MADKIRICLIDDTPAELVLYREVYNGVAGVEAFAALTLKDFQALEVEAPDIFTLDVAYVLGEERNEKRVVQLLKNPPIPLPLMGDHAQILRDAYVNSQLATEYFAELQDATVNHTRGGIRLAQAVHEAYPDVPIVGYSRKTPETSALVYLYATYAIGFFRKPNDLFSWEKTERLTELRAEQFVADWRRIVDMSPGARHHVRGALQSAAMYLFGQPGILREQAQKEGLVDFLPDLAHALDF